MTATSINNTNEHIYSPEDILTMLDSLLREPAPFWNNFYTDKSKNIPFFCEFPDENLVSYFNNKTISPKKALELGCGPGRNAIYMTKQGCEVTAVDISDESINWARERAADANLDIQFICHSIFNLAINEPTYDFVYDSGCFHHIPPHRRFDYLNLLEKALQPNGYFALTCFSSESDCGADISDWEVYKSRSMHGGLAYSEEKLRRIFSKSFDIIEVRPMREDVPNTMTGAGFLWTALFKRHHRDVSTGT